MTNLAVSAVQHAAAGTAAAARSGLARSCSARSRAWACDGSPADRRCAWRQRVGMPHRARAGNAYCAVIHHQDEPVGVRNVVVDQVPDAVRPVDPGALVAHPNHAPALQWGGHEEAGDHPTADVFRVVADGTVRRLPLQRRLQSTLDDAAANAADGDRMDRDLVGNRGIGSGGADLALVSREQDGRAGQRPVVLCPAQSGCGGASVPPR
jgi:hypothetical protein